MGIELTIFAGCGRVDFHDPSGDPIHLYQLEGNLTDDRGGPPLDGEKCARGTNCLEPGSVGYPVDVPNLGLALADAMPREIYTIDLMISFDHLPVSTTACDGYAKVLDFKNLTTDQGLYVRDHDVRFATGNCDSFATTDDAPLRDDTLVELTISRDENQKVVVWVNKHLEHGLTFTDDQRLAVFDQPDATAHFGDDDAATGGNEWKQSTIFQITIWDFPLGVDQVRGIPPLVR